MEKTKLKKPNQTKYKKCARYVTYFGMIYIQKIREFDPGSGLTLAVHIRHASRTGIVINGNKIYLK